MTKARRRVAGLVWEGATDVLIFERIIREVWPEIEDVLRLHPELDELDRARGSSGWTGVERWCTTHADKLSSVIDPGIGPPLDLLVVALDADVAALAGIEDPPARGSAYDTTRLCDTIKRWLTTPTRSTLPRELVIAIPAMATEAWAIAGLYPRARQPERVDAPAQYLVERGKLEWDPDPRRRARGKVRKDPARYRAIAHAIAKQLARVRSSCPEAERLCAKLERARDRARR
jgi:hypothetical protein